MHDDERARLIAGHLAGDLSSDDSRALSDLRASDPGVEVEISRAEQTAAVVQSIGSWVEVPPAPDLRARIVESVRAPQSTPRAHGDVRDIATAPSSLRRRTVWAVTAAACLALGIGATLGTQAIVDAPLAGAPGTLGARETVDFEGEPSGVSVEGSVVAHTWGTETVLEIDGLTTDSYEVVLVSADGTESQSGTFLGSTVLIECSMNAAVLRQAVDVVEIRDASGSTVASADLPAVQS